MTCKEPYIVEHWNELESPLIELDNYLLGYCEVKNIIIDINYHDWPNRILRWANGDIKRDLEVSLDAKMKTYEIIGYASTDEHGYRWIKIIPLKQDIMPPLSEVVMSNLSSYVEAINQIKRSELNKSAKLKEIKIK